MQIAVWMAFCVVCVVAVSYNTKHIVPPFPRPTDMIAHIPKDSQTFIHKDVSVILTQKTIDELYPLIKPTRYYSDQIHKSIHTIRVRLEIRFEDGTSKTMYIRTRGVNPAIVSFDDAKYYWADGSSAHDGSVAILRVILNQ